MKKKILDLLLEKKKSLGYSNTKNIHLKYLDAVEDDDRGGDHQTLAHFQAIHPRVYVDGVSAKHRQQYHVYVVENTCGDRQIYVDNIDIRRNPLY